MKSKSTSIGINKWAGGMELTHEGTVGVGDATMIAWRRADGARAIETSGDPAFEGERCFDVTWDWITGIRDGVREKNAAADADERFMAGMGGGM